MAALTGFDFDDAPCRLMDGGLESGELFNEGGHAAIPFALEIAARILTVTEK